MKNISTFLVAILLTLSVFAQVPEKMSYQAVIRNASDELVKNQAVGMQISILQGSAYGTTVYIETQMPTTNINGLVSVEIGNGTVLSGDFSSIDWSNDTYFIKTETDPEGGTAYSITGTSQLLSVPYSLHAKTAEKIVGVDTILESFTEVDPVYQADSSALKASIANNQKALNDTAAKIRADIPDVSNFLTEETDPTFIDWDKSSGIKIKESQITNLDHFTNADETDPVFSGWDKSTGIEITESQILDLSHFTNSDEADQVYASDSSYLKTGVNTWNNSLAKTIDAKDTTRWGSAETDPTFTAWNKSTGIKIKESQITDLDHFTNSDETDKIYASDSSFLKTGVATWNSSVSKGITETDTAYWNNKTYISDVDGDTKIETEQTSDEDAIRIKVAGNEAFNADDTGFDFVLPTNDNTSNLKVMKEDGTVVFGVDGSGMIAGDGSGLSNVRAIANTTGGNQLCPITKNYAYYQNVRSVTITTPSSGKCFVMASGYVRWESKGWDLYLASILKNSDPNTSWDAENDFFHHLNLATDYNCADSSDQYASFAQHRTFNVGAGTQTFTLWANKYSSSAKVRMDDVNLTVLFFPTSGTGGGILKSTQLEDEDESSNSSEPFTSLPRRPDGGELKKRLDAMINEEKKIEKVSNVDLIKLQETIDELKAENESLRREKSETDKRINIIETQIKLMMKSKNIMDRY